MSSDLLRVALQSYVRYAAFDDLSRHPCISDQSLVVALVLSRLDYGNAVHWLVFHPACLTVSSPSSTWQLGRSPVSVARSILQQVQSVVSARCFGDMLRHVISLQQVLQVDVKMAVSGGFYMNYHFAITRLLNHVPYFRNFNDVTNTAARCSSPSDNFNFHCHMPLKNAKFDLFGSENTSLQSIYPRYFAFMQLLLRCPSV